VTRCRQLARWLGQELLAVVDAMASGDYWREPPSSDLDPPAHRDPAYWD
jgi:hypothetical protein